MPYRFLRIEQIQVGVSRQHTLGETLLETDLELHVTVIAVGLATQHSATHKIGILVETEVGTVVKFFTDTVGNLSVSLFSGDNLPPCRNVHPRKQCEATNYDKTPIIHIFI